MEKMASPTSDSGSALRRHPRSIAWLATASASDGCSSSATPFEFHSLDGGAPVAKRWCHTRIEAHKFSFSWTIHNFSLCPQETGQPLDSSTFSAGSDNQMVWRLRAYPRGMKEECKDTLSLGLVLVSSHVAEVRANFCVSIVTADDEELAVCTKQGFRFVPGTSAGNSTVLPLDTFRKNTRLLLPEDKLTILCEGSAVANTTDFSGSSSGLQVDVPEGRLSDDFSALLEKQKLSDVTLRVGGRDLPAHKVILAARSPVFAATFQHNTTEKNQNIVVINDMDYDVLREMLVYIYTGKSPNIEKLSEDLLAASDKYDLTGLKMMCEVVLCSTLTVENAAKLLVLGNTYRAKQLKEQAICLITSRSKSVVLTPAWKDVSSTHPNLIIEVFEAQASQEVSSNV